MRQQHQKELDALRQENVEMRNMCRSWRSLEPTTTNQEQTGTYNPGRGGGGGVHSSHHHMSLGKQPFRNSPKPGDELRQRAAKYMQMEELTEYRNQAISLSNNERREGDLRREGDSCKRSRERYAREQEPRGPKYAHYTPLTTDCTRMLDEALNIEALQYPRKAITPPRADTRKYCKYHRNHSHTTEECSALMDKIEELIQSGELRHYVQRNQGGEGRGGGKAVRGGRSAREDWRDQRSRWRGTEKGESIPS